jgi:hypothetical protein
MQLVVLNSAATEITCGVADIAAKHERAFAGIQET